MTQTSEEDSDWVDASGCENLAYEKQGCTLVNLHCNTMYYVRIIAVCSDQNANSNPSESKGFQTLVGDECLLAASSPTSVVATNPSTSTMELSWVSGAANDCSFAAWKVESRPENTVLWESVSGCDELVSRDTTT